jgi:hypothetical protein
MDARPDAQEAACRLDVPLPRGRPKGGAAIASIAGKLHIRHIVIARLQPESYLPVRSDDLRPPPA